MDILEYDKVKNLSYDEYCNYLAIKYKENKQGLFKHHIYENMQANLSNDLIRKHFIELNPDKLDYANAIVYCDYLEHLLLHIMIGEQTDSRKCLGLGGAVNYIIPQLNNYLDNDVKIYSDKYYENIDRNLFNILVKRCEDALNKTRIALDFNDTLYKQVEYNLDTNNKALIVLGTGLGKTTTALQYLWSNKCRALAVVPNRLIKTGWEEYSDWVDTITYQSFSNRYYDLNYSNYGLVILDEAHHSAYDEIKDKGAKTWSKGISYILDKGIKVLGLTATPERSDKINIEKTIFKDCVCEGLAVEDAIEQNIIHPFSYITALYDTSGILDEYKDCDNKELVGQLNVAINNTPTLKQILVNRMPEGKRKGIVFIQDINDEDTVRQIIQDTFPNSICKTIHSKKSQIENDRVKKWFEETDEGYLIAINMISEGAHYKGVNTIIMFRKTSSYLVFTQQLGRIITLTKNENPNAIVFDLVNNINNVEYNSLESDLKQTHNIKRIVEKLKTTEAAISNQIIIADESNEIVDAIRKIKEYGDVRWTEEEIEILKMAEGKRYRSKEWRELLPRKSLTAIKRKGKELGLQINSHNNWTNQQLEELKINYEEKGPDYLVCLFKGRHTRQSIIGKAHQLNLNFDFYADKHLSEEEQQIVKDNYYKGGPKLCLKLLQNKYSESVIRKVARKFGIKYKQISDEQLQFIIDNAGKLTIKELINLTNLGNCQISSIIKQYNLITKSPRDKKWTKDEDDVIKKYYSSQDWGIMLKLLSDRTKSSIQSRASILNIHIEKRAWTTEEDSIIKEYYPIGGKNLCKTKLLDKNLTQIAIRARKLNIKYDKYFEQYWTQEEDDIIKEYYPSEGKNCINRLSGRTETNIQGRACFLNVKYKATLPKKVLCVEKDEIFNSISEAQRKYGRIGFEAALKDQAKTAGGYHWKYIEEEDDN